MNTSTDFMATLSAMRVRTSRLLLSRRFATVLLVASVVAGLATFIALSKTTSSGQGSNPMTVLALLYVDLILMLLLGVVVAQRIVRVWAERRSGQAGSALHVRMVFMFSMVAVTPAIMVAVFAALFLNFGVHAWFSERVRTAIESSSAVASAYLQEHLENIRADTFAMANDLNRTAAQLANNPRRFSQALSTQAAVRGLTEAIVVDGAGKAMARSRFSMSLEFDLVPPGALEKARQGEIVIITAPQDDRVRAVVKLDRFVEAYLLVGRFIESDVLDHIAANSSAVKLYQSLNEKRDTIQITFVAIFVVVALLLLLAAVWIGMTIANQLVRPISSLIEAADKVSGGDLTVRVDPEAAVDEIQTLSHAFNVMTDRLQTQQAGLMKVNTQLDERRRFTETVLSGVSAGVIGLDEGGHITLPNRSASELLQTNLDEHMEKHLGDIVPEMAALIAQVTANPDRVSVDEINIVRGGEPRTLIVNMASERLRGDVIGYVVTFDDITELQTAQRTAAWSGIAQRIAHEIKNPLTPIQLAAERLRKKYLKQIKDDPETFEICTATIIRQVEELGRMVDEFSSFARMPQAVSKLENVSELCRQAVFLEKNRNTKINFELNMPKGDVQYSCDARQVSRALGNVIKNAVESVSEHMDNEGGGNIAVTLINEIDDSSHANIISVRVEDNGMGLPEGNPGRLTEPYVTARDHGTGLGLAIVKKIMEDHGGELLLANRDGGGAVVVLLFPPVEDAGEAAAKDSTRKGVRSHGA